MTGGFDLARSEAIGLDRLEAVRPEIQLRPAFRIAADAALELLAVFCAFGLQHVSSPTNPLRARFAARGRDAARLRIHNPGFLGHRIVLHDFALEDPDFDPNRAIRRPSGRRPVIDVRTKRM